MRDKWEPRDVKRQVDHHKRPPRANYRMNPPRLFTPLSYVRTVIRACRAAPVHTTVQLDVSRSTGLRSLARISRRPIDIETARRGALQLHFSCCTPCLRFNPRQRGDPHSSHLSRTIKFLPSVSLALSRATGDARVVGTAHVCVPRRDGARRVTSGANFKTDLNGLTRSICIRTLA